MRNVVIGLVMGLVLAGGLAFAANVYTLREISDFATEPAKCAADGGRGALIAELDETGALASEWQAYCVLEVK